MQLTAVNSSRDAIHLKSNISSTHKSSVRSQVFHFHFFGSLLYTNHRLVSEMSEKCCCQLPIQVSVSFFAFPIYNEKFCNVLRWSLSRDFLLGEKFMMKAFKTV